MRLFIICLILSVGCDRKNSREQTFKNIDTTISDTPNKVIIPTLEIENGKSDTSRKSMLLDPCWTPDNYDSFAKIDSLIRLNLDSFHLCPHQEQNIVFVAFHLDKDGNPDRFSVIKSHCAELTQDISNVIKLVKFKPTLCNDKPVDTIFSYKFDISKF